MARGQQHRGITVYTPITLGWAQFSSHCWLCAHVCASKLTMPGAVCWIWELQLARNCPTPCYESLLPSKAGWWLPTAPRNTIQPPPAPQLCWGSCRKTAAASGHNCVSDLTEQAGQHLETLPALVTLLVQSPRVQRSSHRLACASPEHFPLQEGTGSPANQPEHKKQSKASLTDVGSRI